MEAIQLLNTAVVKSKEKDIKEDFEERLKRICDSSEIKFLSQAITGLAEEKGISPDQAAMCLVDTVKELDSIWGNYLMLEGMDKLKDMLNGN